MNLLLVYSAYPTKESAKQAGKMAVLNELAVCVNTFACDSVYFWKGKLEECQEYVSVFKTADDKISSLCDFLKKTHPYSVPAIISIEPYSVNSDYLAWVEGNSANRV